MSAIDLSLLPAPKVIKEIDFETLYAERKAALIALYQEDQRAGIAAALETDAEPMAKLLQENAYRELLLRQHINESAQAVMLPFSKDEDLDNLAAFFNIARNPGELDDSLRRRALASFFGLSVAGPREAYNRHAREADPGIKDVDTVTPGGGIVLVTILSMHGNGTPSAEQLAAVNTALSADTVRPLCDTVQVQGAAITSYAIEATVDTASGPSGEVVRAASQNAAQRYADATHRINGVVTRSGLYAALRQPGVTRVTLALPTQPAGDSDILIQPGPLGAAYCTKVTVKLGMQNG